MHLKESSLNQKSYLSKDKRRRKKGKFLIELRDENVMSAIGISHYVSLDTEKLEIYDPSNVKGWCDHYSTQ
jgi:hypothetical protein